MAGRYPAFETHDVFEKRHDRFLSRHPGFVVKWVDPWAAAPPMPEGFDYRILFCRRRDKAEQAKSHVKLLSSTDPDLPIDASPSKMWAVKCDLTFADNGILEKCEALARKENVLPLWFEDVLAEPMTAAKRICSFLLIQHGWADAMAGVVIKRGPKNYPGLLEVDLLERHLKEQEQAQA